MSQDNPWSGSVADRRLFRATAPSLTATTAGLQNDPWLAAVASGTAIASDPGVGTKLRVQFIARDGFSGVSPEPVEIALSGARVDSIAVDAAGGTAGAIIESGGPLNNAANTGAVQWVTPNATTGKVDVTFTLNAGATVLVNLRHRHITAAASVVVA